MPRELKVWGGVMSTQSGRQKRCIVATRTKKRAMELLGCSITDFNNFFCETHNKRALEIALADPEQVYVTHIHRYEPFAKAHLGVNTLRITGDEK